MAGFPTREVLVELFSDKFCNKMEQMKILGELCVYFILAFTAESAINSSEKNVIKKWASKDDMAFMILNLEHYSDLWLGMEKYQKENPDSKVTSTNAECQGMGTMMYSKDLSGFLGMQQFDDILTSLDALLKELEDWEVLNTQYYTSLELIQAEQDKHDEKETIAKKRKLDTGFLEMKYPSVSEISNN